MRIRLRLIREGTFKVSPTPRTYYFFEPNMKNVSSPIADIYIHFNGYLSKKYDYSQFLYQQNKPHSEVQRLDVGIIYLDPE